MLKSIRSTVSPTRWLCTILAVDLVVWKLTTGRVKIVANTLLFRLLLLLSLYLHLVKQLALETVLRFWSTKHHLSFVVISLLYISKIIDLNAHCHTWRRLSQSTVVARGASRKFDITTVPIDNRYHIGVVFTTLPIALFNVSCNWCKHPRHELSLLEIFIEPNLLNTAHAVGLLFWVLQPLVM